MVGLGSRAMMYGGEALGETLSSSSTCGYCMASGCDAEHTDVQVKSEKSV
jgi:hypothetical protein